MCLFYNAYSIVYMEDHRADLQTDSRKAVCFSPAINAFRDICNHISNK